MSKPFVPVVLGSARVGRQSEKAAKYFLELLQNSGLVETELIDVKDYILGRTIPPYEETEETKPWKDLVKKSLGFFFVVPEYNHGYPGEFKMLLDQESKAYEGKRVAICGVSSGPIGGARMIENILPVLNHLGLVVTRTPLYVFHDVTTLELPKAELDKIYLEKTNNLINFILGK